MGAPHDRDNAESLFLQTWLVRSVATGSSLDIPEPKTLVGLSHHDNKPTKEKENQSYEL